MTTEYRDPRRSAQVLEWALSAFIVMDVIFTLGEVYTVGAISQFLAGSDDMGALEASDQIGVVTGGIFFLAYLVCVILTCVWIYRVNKNAYYLNAEHMTVSPGWNVGYFFIPFANLLMPFRGLRETYQVSTNTQSPDEVPVPGLMRLWWGCWLLSGFLGQLSFRLSLRAVTLEDLLLISQLNIVSIVPELAAARMLLWLVRDVTRNQQCSLVTSEAPTHVGHVAEI